MRRPLSLKARALQLLALREHSRVELRQKLLRRAAAVAEREEEKADDPASVETRVDALLDWLEANRYLSTDRFIESRIQARQSRFGNLRIRAELAQHRLTASDEANAALAASELDRAAEVRQRRFGDEVPGDAAARAAQSRFLTQRGFSPEVVHRLLRRRSD